MTTQIGTLYPMSQIQKISRLFQKFINWLSGISNRRLILLIAVFTLTCTLLGYVIHSRGLTIKCYWGFVDKVCEARSKSGAGVTVQVLDEVRIWVWQANNPTPILLWPR